MPDAVLFQLSDGEKRRYFKTEYILGTQYLHVTNDAPTYEQIRNQAHNWQDYHRFRAMYMMFREGDGCEILLASDGYIYRVDTTDSFVLKDLEFSAAGINEIIAGDTPKEVIKRFTEQLDYDNCWRHHDFCRDLQFWIKEYGEECRKHYLEPFVWIQEVSKSYIDDVLNTLCYFYPDFIGGYFKRFIVALQKRSAIVLKDNLLGSF